MKFSFLTFLGKAWVSQWKPAFLNGIAISSVEVVRLYWAMQPSFVTGPSTPHYCL